VQQKLQGAVERYQYSRVKTGGYLTAMVAASIKPLIIMFRDFKRSWYKSTVAVCCCDCFLAASRPTNQTAISI